MQLCRDVAMMALGAVGVLVYQKCKDPVMDKIDYAVDMVLDKASDKLEKMK